MKLNTVVKSIRFRSGVLWAAGCLCAFAGADDLAVRNGEVVDVVVSNDVAFAGNVYFAPQGRRIEKGGAGTWSFAPSAVQTRADVPVVVREGRLRVVDAPAPELTEPACLQRAALWLDATRPDTLEMADGGAGVSRWYDVRETKEAGAWASSYYCAEARISFCTNQTADGTWEKYIKYPVVKTYDARPGQSYVDFNGRESGSWMQFVSTNRTASAMIDGIRHVFYCGYVTNAWGFVLGTTGNIFWHPNSTAGVLDRMYSQQNSMPEMLAGTTYWNGKVCDGVEHFIPRGPYACEWTAGATTGSFNNFFNDRNIWNAVNHWRCGGDSLGEVVVFTNRLSEAERQQVGEWLVRKWAAAAAPGAVTVKTVRGASVEPAGGSAALDGDGTIEAASNGLHVVYSTAKPYVGSTYIAANAVKLESVEPTLKMRPGDALALTRDDFEVLSAVHTDDVSLEAAGAASLALAPTTTVRIAELADDVKKLRVVGAEGTLILSAPRTSVPIRPASEIWATMENADMEDWPSGNATELRLMEVGKVYHGWKVLHAQGQCYFFDLVNAQAHNGHWVIDGGTKSNFRYADYPFQGRKVLAFKQAFILSNVVTFPTDGDYDLTFLSGGRMNEKQTGNDYAGGWTKMALVDAAGVTNEIGTALAYVECSMRHQRFRVRGVKAGTYTFILNHDVGTGDAHSIFDDFKFRLVTDIPTETTCPLPNGDFERADFTWNGRLARSAENVPANWTLAQSQSGTPDVCLITRGTSQGGYQDRGSAYGGIHLALYGTNGTATSTAMTVPPGTWRLRCRMGGVLCAEGTKWNDSKVTAGYAVQVWKIDGDDEVSLGKTATSWSSTFRTVTFDTPFTVATPTSVRFKVRQIGADSEKRVACALVDDLELVRVTAREELVTNGMFMNTANGGWTADGWTFKGIKDGSESTKLASVHVDDPGRTWTGMWPDYPYGVTYGTGTKALDMCQCGTATQPMTFPAAGTYRLEFSARSRIWVNKDGVGNLGYAGNQASFFLVDDAGETNEIYRTPSLTSSNFVFRSTLFTVPKAGTYTFGVLSLNGLPLGDGTYLKVGRSARDVELFIDQISVKKVAEDVLPELPEKLELDLAKGVKMRLDYTGTMELDTLRLNGVSVAGLIDASHPSGLVAGTGRLYVRPKGTVLIFR